MKVCWRNLIVRVAFYGLMILGPTFLSIGHSYYVKARQQRVDLFEISQTGDKRNSNELRCVVYDAAGMICCACWLIWMGGAIIIKIVQLWGRCNHESNKGRAQGKSTNA